MSGLPPILETVIQSFSRFPGIGRKTAQRLTLHVMKADKDFILNFARALTDAKEKIGHCRICGNYAEEDRCHICDDPARDVSKLCIVEEPSDILLFEKAGYRGLYHVLGGVISPLDGVSPDDLNFNGMMDRVNEVDEVIIATNANIEGDATAMYILQMLEKTSIKISRLARGVPVGGQLEYVDEVTLSRSLTERVKVK